MWGWAKRATIAAVTDLAPPRPRNRYCPSLVALVGLSLGPALCAISGCSGPGTSKNRGQNGNVMAGGDVGAGQTLTPKQVVQRATPAIVRIEVEGPNGGEAFGTGFVLSADGRIATNLHVISGATDVRVSLHDGTRLALDQIAAIDPLRDLAIITVQSRDRLPILPLGNSDDVEAGDPVIVIGNPLGVLDYSVSDGLISAVRPVTRRLTVLQISAPISQGSSGGPLFNAYGEVIGVATAIAGQGQNLNFGIPSNYLLPLLSRDDGLTLRGLSEKLRDIGDPSGRSPATTGAIQRKVPQHPVSLLDGCSKQSVATAVDGISSAIQIGAPLYNEGNHEACYRVYEGTAIRLERELPCEGLREALGQGLLRASTEEGYTLKAWAMRDAFDGVLLVAKKKHPDLLP